MGNLWMQLNYSLSGHDLFLLVSFYGFLSVFGLEGKKLFSAGAMRSNDRLYRTEHESWLPQETIDQNLFARFLESPE